MMAPIGLSKESVPAFGKELLRWDSKEEFALLK
jgi:hypothetical protein